MTIINEEINFNIDEKTEDGKADFVSIDILEDQVVFYKLWNNKGNLSDGVYPHTYVSHQYCGGDIFFVKNRTYKFMYCYRCGFKIKFPIIISTVSDLKTYFEKNQELELIDNRFEILDL